MDSIEDWYEITQEDIECGAVDQAVYLTREATLPCPEAWGLYLVILDDLLEDVFYDA